MDFKRCLLLLKAICVTFSSDFLKQTTYEVEAFLEAIQFFRQEKGHYGTWEMITGSEKEVKQCLPDLGGALAAAAARIELVVRLPGGKKVFKEEMLKCRKTQELLLCAASGRAQSFCLLSSPADKKCIFFCCNCLHN